LWSPAQGIVVASARHCGHQRKALWSPAQGIVVASAQGIVVEVKLKSSRDLFPV
jgi:hypothetical protein